VFLGYFDDSGEHDSPQSGGHTVRLTIGGAWASLEAWETLGREWNGNLGRFGIPMFHMTDFENRQRPFDRLEEHERRDLLNSLLDTIARCTKTLLSFTNPVLDGDLGAAHKYGTIDAMLYGARTDSVMGMVFARGSHVSEVSIRSWYDLLKPQAPLLQPPEIKDPQSCPQLQAADLIAYEMAKEMRRDRTRRRRHPLTYLNEHGVTWRTDFAVTADPPASLLGAREDPT
jgi:hypothetical protein